MSPEDELSRRTPEVIRRHSILITCLILFAASFALYTATMAPGLTWENEGGDGGDFLAAAHTWGIPHPTGYPTYLVLLKSFSALIWFGDEALKANLFSAFAGALSIPIFFLATRKLLLRLPITDTRGRVLPSVVAVVVALAFATSNLHWSQSTITEVYALNAMFCVLFLWLVLIARARIERGDRALWIRTGMAFLLGIAFGNHVTIIFIALPFGVWLYWTLAKSGVQHLLREWQTVLALITGLAVYIYAPIASAQDPALNWFFPDTFSGFWSMASASLYQSYVFAIPMDQIADRIIATFDKWLTQFTAVGAVLGLAGVMLLWGRLKGFAIAGAASVLALVVYAISYNSFDSYVLLIPVFIVFGLWIASGLLNLVVNLITVAERSNRGWLQANRRHLAAMIIVVALIGMPVWSLAFNYSSVDISDDTEASDYVSSAFDVAGQGAVIIAEDIPTFSLWYQSLVVKPEQDVAVIATFLLGFDWYWDHIQRQFPDRVPIEAQGGSVQRIRAIVANNLGNAPVFLTREDASYSNLFNLATAGPLWRVEG